MPLGVHPGYTNGYGTPPNHRAHRTVLHSSSAPSRTQIRPPGSYPSGLPSCLMTSTLLSSCSTLSMSFLPGMFNLAFDRAVNRRGATRLSSGEGRFGCRGVDRRARLIDNFTVAESTRKRWRTLPGALRVSSSLPLRLPLLLRATIAQEGGILRRLRGRGVSRAVLRHRPKQRHATGKQVLAIYSDGQFGT